MAKCSTIKIYLQHYTCGKGTGDVSAVQLRGHCLRTDTEVIGTLRRLSCHTIIQFFGYNTTKLFQVYVVKVLVIIPGKPYNLRGENPSMLRVQPLNYLSQMKSHKSSVPRSNRYLTCFHRAYFAGKYEWECLSH